MDAKEIQAEKAEKVRQARYEIQDIIRQLSMIRRELNEISSGIENEFKGIGAPLCSQNIRDISEQYKYVTNQLNSI